MNFFSSPSFDVRKCWHIYIFTYKNINKNKYKCNFEVWTVVMIVASIINCLELTSFKILHTISHSFINY